MQLAVTQFSGSKNGQVWWC